MATKQMIVAICLTAASLLVEARISFHETHKTSRANFEFHKKANVPKAKSDVDLQAIHPEAFLTTVRVFLYYDDERGNSGGRAPWIPEVIDLETRVVAYNDDSYTIQYCVVVKTDQSAYSNDAQILEADE
jgi:hypothetical protein